MSKVFLTIVRMGLVSGYAVLVVLLVRRLLRRFPKRYSYLLWSVVFLRLVCPIGINSSFSLIPNILFADAEKENADSLQVAPFRGENGAEDGKILAAFHMVRDAGYIDAGYTEYQDRDANAEHTAPVGGGKAEAEKLVNSIPDKIPYHSIPENKNTSKDFFSDNENLHSNPPDSPEKNTKKPQASETRKNSLNFILCFLWIAGILVFWLVWARSIWRFRKKLVGAVCVEEGVYEISSVTTSFVDGIFHPVIYLAPGLSGAARKYVLCHERVHIRRKDPQIKAAALFLVSIYWFHPLIWLAFRKMCEDMEMSCDERVVELLGVEIKKEYSCTLLKMAQGTKGVSLLAAFGGNEVKSRVKNVLSYRKPKNWIAVLLLLLVVIVGVGLGLNPGGKNASASGGNMKEGSLDDVNLPKEEGLDRENLPNQEGADLDDVNLPKEEGQDGENFSNKEDDGKEDFMKEYNSILTSYYTALKEEWKPGKLVEEGFSSLASYCYGENVLENIGYYFLDLDSDGVPELLIGAIAGDEFISQQIFELYHLKDKNPERVFSGRERDRYYLCRDEDRFVIANEGSSSASNSVWNYYIVKEGQLSAIETIVYNGQTDEEDPWSYTAGEDSALSKREMVKEAEDIIKIYEECRTMPKYHPFTDLERIEAGETGADEGIENRKIGKKIRGESLENQLDFILSKKEIWEQDDELIAEEIKYTVVDLNGNGRLELIAASCQGTGHYTYADIYEVSEDGNSLIHYTHTVPEGDSQADIIWGVAPVYYSQKENVYRYIFDDLIRAGATYYYESKKSLELKENRILETTLAYRITEYIDSAPVVTYGAEGGLHVTNQQEYESAADKVFEGWQKGMAYFLWFTAPDQKQPENEEDLQWLWYKRLQISYRSFSVVEYSDSLTSSGQDENADVEAEFLQSWKEEAEKEGYSEEDALEWYEKFQSENIPLESGDIISALCLDDYDKNGVTDCFLAVSKYGNYYDKEWDGSPHTVVWGNINGKFCKVALWADPVIALTIIAGDVNHDGFTEIVIRGDTGACGLPAVRPHWMFSLRNGEIQEMKLPSQYDYGFDMGVGCYEILVYPTENDSICRAVLVQDGREKRFTVFEDERNYASKLDEADPGWRDKKKGFGGNGESYFTLEIITQDGREYLLGTEYLFCNAVGGAIGQASLVFDWDKNGDAYVKDFYMEPSV